MQPVSPAVVQHRYLPAYQPFTIASPPTFKSIDRTIFGPSAPPIKNTKTAETDQRRLILFNVPVDLIQEYLELYLEHLSGEKEIERIDYSNLDETTVMVTFKTDLSRNERARARSPRSPFVFRHGGRTPSACHSIQAPRLGHLTRRGHAARHSDD